MIEETRNNNTRLINTSVFDAFLPYEALNPIDLYKEAQTDPIAMTLFALSLSPQLTHFLTSRGMNVEKPSAYVDRAIEMGALEPRYFKAISLVTNDDRSNVGKEALELIIPLINRKHPPSLHAAAGIYKKNLGDLVAAEKYYLEAAELGSGQSYIDLAGVLLYNSSADSSDIARAISYYDKAIHMMQSVEAVQATVRASFDEPHKFPSDALVRLLQKHAANGDFDCSQALLEIVGSGHAPLSAVTPTVIAQAKELLEFCDPTVVHAMYAYVEKSGSAGLLSVNDLILICDRIVRDPFFDSRGKGNAVEVRGKIDLYGLCSNASLQRACANFEFGEKHFNSGRCARYFGLTMLKLGNVREGFMKAVELMQEGDPESMALVGYCLLEGKGCEKDPQEGNKILQEARKRGAQFSSPFV